MGQSIFYLSRTVLASILIVVISGGLLSINNLLGFDNLFGAKDTMSIILVVTGVFFMGIAKNISHIDMENNTVTDVEKELGKEEQTEAFNRTIDDLIAIGFSAKDNNDLEKALECFVAILEMIPPKDLQAIVVAEIVSILREEVHYGLAFNTLIKIEKNVDLDLLPRSVQEAVRVTKDEFSKKY
jgi:arginine exporter protein ArgO